MRKIIFRMWSSKAKKFFLCHQVFECLGQQFNHDSQIAKGLSFDHIADGQIFEQFIGLYDKNGKEIYEGDIITRHRKPAPGVVVYEAPEFVLKKGKFSLGLDVGPLEIIGNIHENPELLQSV